jgi:hypothetical protein
VSIEGLPPYVRPEEPAPPHRIMAQRQRAVVALTGLLALDGGVLVGVLAQPPPRPLDAFVVFAAGTVLVAGLGLAQYLAGRQPALGSLPAVGHVWWGSRRVFTEVALAAAVLGVGVAVAVLSATAGVLVAAVVTGSASTVGLHLVREVREERRTGWRRVLMTWGRRGERPLRTWAGDDLHLAELRAEVTLPAPLAEVGTLGLHPFTRWAMLQAGGRGEEALALAARAFSPEDPTWGGWAALSALALERPDEAERWIRRSADVGYAGGISPIVARALRPLHGTDAWRDLAALNARGRPSR